MAGLSISSGQDGASQSATSNPQTVPGSTNGPSTTSGSGVQPGTTSTLLTNSTGGIPLGGQNLTTVNLDSDALAVTKTTTATTTKPAPTKHQITPVFGVITASLIVVFIISIVWTMRSAKSTTNS